MESITFSTFALYMGVISLLLGAFMVFLNRALTGLFFGIGRRIWDTLPMNEREVFDKFFQRERMPMAFRVFGMVLVAQGVGFILISILSR